MANEIMEKEILKKLRAAKSPEEFLDIAKANGTELTAEQAKAGYDRLCGSGELSDDDLDKIAGGAADEEWYIRVSAGF